MIRVKRFEAWSRNDGSPRVRLHPVACAVLLAALALPAEWAIAQQTGRSGSQGTEPGQIEKRIEVPPPPPDVVMPTVPPPPAAKEVMKFVLGAVQITGVTIYRPAELSSFYEAYLGREVTFADVEKILEAITGKYREDGYVLSRAVAPPQRIELGILRVRVIEGFVAKVRFKGADPGRMSLLQAYADKITAVRPTTLSVLERYLLLMGDLPGVRVTPRLTPVDAETGAYELILSLTHKRQLGFLNLSNRGTRTAGPLQALAGANLNSLLGMLDQTRLIVFFVPDNPSELVYFSLAHEQQVGTEGTTVSLAASRSDTETGNETLGTKTDGVGTRFTLALSHPLVRSSDQTLRLTVKFDIVNSKKTGISGKTEDRLRVVRLGGRYELNDALAGTNKLALELSQGLDIFNASPEGATNVSRLNGRGDFTKVTAEASRRQGVGKSWALQFAAIAQHSNYTLLTPEQFTLGGSRFGRAYNPSEISGDRGAAASVELRYEPAFKLELMKLDRVYAYYDAGAVWGAGFTRFSLASAGIGLNVTVANTLIAKFEVAKPLTRPVADEIDDGDDLRFFFNLTAVF